MKLMTDVPATAIQALADPFVLARELSEPSGRDPTDDDALFLHQSSPPTLMEKNKLTGLGTVCAAIANDHLGRSARLRGSKHTKREL